MAMRDVFQRVMGRMRNQWNPQPNMGSQFFSPGAGQGSTMGFGSEAPAAGMDMQSLLQNAPEIASRQRRVEQLRAQQEQGQQAAGTAAGGLMLPTQSGGLYETVARYRPDYAGMANQAVGAFGSHISGKQAEAENQGLDALKAAQVARSVQQMSGGRMGGDVPTRMPGAVNAGMANRGANMMRWFQP